MKRALSVFLLLLCMTGCLCPSVLADSCGEYHYKIFMTRESKKEIKKYKTLKSGSSGKSVRKMQKRLIELGYLSDCDESGKFDQTTLDAVYDFQLTNLLTGSDGTAYPYTQYKLFDEYAIPSGGRDYETLWPGDCGWPVTALQKRLIDTGYLADGGADGDYGSATERAVKKFKRENDLDDSDGTAYDWMQDALFSYEMNSLGA